MTAEFRTLFEILRESRAAPVISPLIAEPAPAEVREEEPGDRLDVARMLERFESSLRRLLEEIAAEVLGRELLLAPVDVERIVARLRARYGFSGGTAVSDNGDITLDCDGCRLDAALGRRLRAALERALS